ncbi:MAG TPA: phenylalanine--tRNA ligase subunit alpha [Acidobacteriota bacterium]|nr:phenylalanine--tRNA ligase subunit alpha [Acidobacteriota bacterium]
MVELREHERKTLLAVEKLGGRASAEEIMNESGLPSAAIMRAALVLQEKKLVEMQETRQTVIELNAEGNVHAKKGLPERRMLNALKQLGGKATVERVVAKADLEKQFVPIALGWIQRKKWVALDSKTNTLQALEKAENGSDEKLLELLSEKKKIAVEDFSREFKEAVQVLKKRKLLNVEEKTNRIFKITDAGRAALKKEKKAVEEVTQLTPELIISGKWRKVKLQEYNIEAPVAKTWSGKKHPYLQFLDEVRMKLVALGFKEMTGTFIETSFFNFDALYTPQGHPAREPTSAYYVKSPKYGSVNAYKQALANVKKTHENGWKTESSGWGYKYSVKEAGRLILRSHTTCLSARTLLSKDLKIPGMYFSIGQCYRPEVLDKTHLTEFNQVEGIVVDEDLTLRDLLGVLEKFAIDIAGADRAKFVPDYFPFTEPSVELRAYKKGYGWIEFGGSGIFRPEVTLPLGIEVPVLAWGLGIDRLFMLKAGIDDIRQIFSLDLDWLRRQEMV